MDARAKGHGIIVPSPQSHSSELGNVVYFDKTGFMIAFASIFAERSLPRIPGGLSGLSGLSSEWQVARKSFPDVVSMTTTGVLAKPMDRSEYQRQSPVEIRSDLLEVSYCPIPFLRDQCQLRHCSDIVCSELDHIADLAIASY